MANALHFAACFTPYRAQPARITKPQHPRRDVFTAPIPSARSPSTLQPIPRLPRVHDNTVSTSEAPPRADPLELESARYPCRRVGAEVAQSGTWEGVPPGAVLRAQHAVQPQRDRWSCMANSAARAACSVQKEALDAPAFVAFAQRCRGQPAHALQGEIRAHYAHLPSQQRDALLARILKAHPEFGPEPATLASRTEEHLPVFTQVWEPQSAAECTEVLRAAWRNHDAVIALFVYGDLSMHYVTLLGMDGATQEVGVLETSGQLYSMRLEHVLDAMHAKHVLAHGTGRIATYNAVQVQGVAAAVSA